MEFPDAMISINIKEEEMDATVAEYENTMNIDTENYLQIHERKPEIDIEGRLVNSSSDNGPNIIESVIHNHVSLSGIITPNTTTETVQNNIETIVTPDIQNSDITSEIKTENTENPFQNVQLIVKQEDNINSEMDNSYLEPVKSVQNEPINEVCSLPLSIKEENNDELVSFEYPNFDDENSMDSNDAAALGNVEACLQDDVDIKHENDDNFQEPQKEDIIPDIKMESDMTVTDTVLTPQITHNATDGLKLVISMKPPKDFTTTKHTGNGILHETSVTENCFNGVANMDCSLYQRMSESSEVIVNDDLFQLNSITGNYLSLEQEAKRMTGKGFNCKMCPKYCHNKQSYKRHLDAHQCIENYANGIRKRKVTIKKNRARRLREMKLKSMKQESEESIVPERKREDPKYACTCGKSFRRRSRMETCLRSHDFFEHSCFPCPTCLKKFKTKVDLSLHKKRVHRKKFPCKFCPTDYDTRKELFKHLQIHQKVQLMEYKVIEEVVKGKHKLKCFMCSKTWTDLSELKTHVMLEHKEPYLCSYCKNTFPKIIDFGNHMKVYHPDVEGQSVLNVLEAFSRLVKEWKCEECNIQFLEPDKLALHQIEKHSPEFKAELQFKCVDCRRVFVSQKGLTSHRRIHHSTETVTETKLEELGIMCLECRTICKDINALTSHMRFHSPDRKYPCKFCDFRFATPEKRKAHLEIHTGDMKFVCFICEYQCSSENRLKQHKMSLKHANMKEYLLTGKPLIEESTSKEKAKEKKEGSAKKRKKMAENSDSKKDNSSSSSSDSEEVDCDICGEKFASEEKMLEHKQTHPFIEFPNDDKPTRIFFK